MPQTQARAESPASPSGAAIDIRMLTRRYGQFVAVDGIGLAICAGEFISLLGPSGSGKSTTLMLLAGFERPDAGTIHLGGKDITRLPPHRRGIGMVFQNYALFPHLTVGENVGFALKQRGVAPAEIAQRVSRAMDMVRLPGFAHRYPQQLSGGQQQRVAIARAIIFDPPVLLMDEPLSALDKQLREEMQFELKSLHARLGITFVYVTHDQREALVMSDRVAVMNHGRIAQLDTPQELYDHPSDHFVASFVGEANFLEISASQHGANGTCRVQVNNQWLDAPSVPGEPRLCMVRPEKILVRPASDQIMPEANSLSAILRDVTFMGETTRCLAQLDESGPMVAAKLAVRGGQAMPSPGALVRLEWAVSDTRLT